jgi:hypothetical protein
MYKPADIRKEILYIIEKHPITKASDIFKHASFGKSVYYRNGFDKDPQIKNLIKEKRKNHKKDLIKKEADKIEDLRRRALQILTVEEEINGERSRKNSIIYRIDFLCARLHVSTATFYDYELHNDPDIRRELDNNKQAVKIDGYSRLLNSKQATGVISFLKLIGSEEERKRLATTFQSIEGNVNVRHSLADEIKELMSYEYIEETSISESLPPENYRRAERTKD